MDLIVRPSGATDCFEPVSARIQLRRLTSGHETCLETAIHGFKTDKTREKQVDVSISIGVLGLSAAPEVMCRSGGPS